MAAQTTPVWCHSCRFQCTDLYFKCTETVGRPLGDVTSLPQTRSSDTTKTPRSRSR